ncbi:MAG TPA: PEP-CTERM sorting domain-containing protein [Lacipirellulaceae bacterium]
MAGAILFVSVLSGPVLSAQINYGSHMGTHVTYVNVTEDSGADEPLPLFGAPTVTGNSIDFNPTGFDATSADVDSDITDSNLVFMVTAKSGSRISSITLNEAGDTTLAGNVTPGSMNTASAVFASGVLDIHEVDFQGINHISVPFALTFNPSGGTYFLGTDGGGGPIFNTQWSGSVTLDIDAILIANGFMIPPGPIDPEGGATKISIDMDNTLVAVSEQGTTSTIGKKDFGGVTIRTNVRTEPGGEPEIPEPATFVLVGLSVLGLGFARRSR